MGWLSDLIHGLFVHTTPTPPTPFDDNVASELLRLANAERTAGKLAPLAADPRCQAAAQVHAQRMADTGVMAHTGVGDGTVGSRLILAGYSWTACAENVAYGQADAAAVMQSWTHSPPHLANLLGGYAHFGGAVARSRSGQTYWCAVFGTPAN